MSQLREVLGPQVVALKNLYTHAALPTLCKRLGLPAPVGEGSKQEKISSIFDEISDTELPRVAERFLELHAPPANVRNRIQDLLWADTGTPAIPKKFRREVARTIEKEPLFLDGQRFDDLLDKLWALDDDPLAFFGTGDRSLRTQIQRHVHRNPDDWSTEQLFDKLPILRNTDNLGGHRFKRPKNF